MASVDGYKYSKAMQAYAGGGAKWDAGRLDTFLAGPKKAVKGTKMAFGGLKKPEQRADLIEFLKNVK